MLAECDVERRARAQGAAALMASWPDGRIKLFLTRAVLHARRCTPDLFDRGAYLPLRTSLVRVFAFARHLDDAWALTIVPRLTAAMGWPIPQRTWDGAAIVLPEGAPQAWTNALTDEPVATQRRTVLVRDAFASIPLALLLSA
jgi:(1->4)-alpha-D-glucan 1-alpha-D-glucosylmutase